MEIVDILPDYLGQEGVLPKGETTAFSCGQAPAPAQPAQNGAFGL
jgi:hypothetical protein